jgi:LuxR family maltose regulon positive regulatory protein
MAHLQVAGNIADAIGGAITLAEIRIGQGRLREAMQTYEQAVQLAMAQHPDGTQPIVRGTADVYVGMSELHYERNDLHAATQSLQKSKQLGEHTGFPQNRYRWYIAMARIQKAQGDLAGALERLQEAERLYVRTFLPNVHPIAALKTRVWIAQERLGEALGWVQDQGLSVTDELSYEREFEHITLARVLLARAMSQRANHSMRDVLELLERLLHAAQAGERMGHVIEIQILQALAYQAQAEIRSALVPLTRALELVEPEGYVRMFVDEGLPMAHLLQEALAHGIMPSYVEKLLSAFPEPDKQTSRQADKQIDHGSVSPISRSPSLPVSQALPEPLSVREQEVLQLLRTDLSGPQIARDLIVSLHTLRTHTNNIYTKLGVNNRRAAVRRAEELGLF